MCDCLRSIFQVNWTPTISSDIEVEDKSKVQVIDKRQCPLTDRPSSVSQISQHICISPEFQDSPERVVQKKKLYAELKEVLKKKGSQLKQSHLKFATMDHSEEKNESVEESHLSELVEMVVETEADIGASGYSVVGGGTNGIFIKDVLKDSPAAKHLSLQKGDQLLSARVYFDNVKYEDALKILQCAEPYKVSFFLKRAVAQTEISTQLETPNIDYRGPRTKMQKMSVQNVKQFKAKKKRGGRFGLKRLKEKKGPKAETEIDIEKSSSRLDFNPADLEFVLPKFKLKKQGKIKEEQAENLKRMKTHDNKTRKIKFPKMKIKSALGSTTTTTTTGETEMNKDKEKCLNLKLKVIDECVQGKKINNPTKFQIPNPNLKTKQRTGDEEKKDTEKKFQESCIHVDGPEIKVRQMDMPSIDISLPKVTPPKVNFNSEGTYIEGKKIQMPDVDISLPKDNFTLPSTKLPEDKMNIDGPHIKYGQVDMPRIDISLPKQEAKINVDIEGHSGKIGKFKVRQSKADLKVEGPDIKSSNFHITDVDVSLPKANLSVPSIKSAESEINVGEHDIKYRKVDIPSVDILSAKGETKANLNIEEYFVKGEKFELPNVSPPKVDFNIEVPDIKGKKIHLHDIDFSLAKEKGTESVDLKGRTGEEERFQMPKVDISLTRKKSPESSFYVDGHNIKVGQVDMPYIDMSSTKTETTIDRKEISEGKGVFKLPRVDIALPNVTLPKTNFNVRGPHIKGSDVLLPKADISLLNVKFPDSKINAEAADIKYGKMDMTSIEISLPKGEAKLDLNTGEYSGIGEKFELPKAEINLEKATSAKVDFNIEVAEVKDRKIHMPDIDISFSKGTETESADLKVTAGKEGRFQMPKVDLSLPRIKLPEGGIHVKGSNIKGGEVDKPHIDISLPKADAKAKIDIKGIPGEKETHRSNSNFEGPHFKGRKFHMPDVNISLPKVDISVPSMKLQGSKIDVEESDFKYGNIEMPSINIPLPNEVGHSDKERKFELPKAEISPKVDFNIEGPGIKGRKINMPDIDLSLPKEVPEGVDLKGEAGKGERFKMPKIDLLIPRIKLTEGAIHVDGPDMEVEKMDKPCIDISLSNENSKEKIDINGTAAKTEKNDVPKIDISLPKVTRLMVDFNVKGPQIKGREFHMPDVDVLLPKVDLSLPSLSKINVKRPDIKYEKVDISLSKGEANVDSAKAEKNELEWFEKGGRFQMPKVDLLLPRINLPEGGIHVDSTDIKAGKVKMPSIEISLPRGNAKQDIGSKGGAVKNTFDVPNLDISLPKVTPPLVDFNVECPHIKGRRFNMPDVDVTLPKVDLSLLGLKLPEGNINVEGPDIKYGKLDMPSVDISLPKTETEVDFNIEGHSGKGGRFEWPKVDISLPSLKLPEDKIKGPDINHRKVDMPSFDILSKGKAKVDLNIKGHSGNGGKFELPKVDISLPKITPPKVDPNIEVPVMQDIDISLPKAKVTEGVDFKDGSAKEGRFQMPKVDLSLPRIKFPVGGIHVDGPDIKVGKVDMPSIDISLPKGNAEQEIDIKCGVGKNETIDLPNLDISLPKVTPPMFDSNVKGPHIKGRKFHMPDFDVSLPKVDLSLPSLNLPEGNINVEGPDIKHAKVDMPSVDLSLPKSRTKVDLNIEEHTGKEGKFESPKVDITLPKVIPPNVDFNIEVPEFKGRKINMPDIDISLPKGKLTEGVDLKDASAKRGRFQMPKVDLSLPRIKLPEGGIHVDGPDIKFEKMDMPSIDISLPKENAEQEIDIKGGVGKNETIDVPNLDISFQKVTPPMFDSTVEGPQIKGRRFNMPDVDVTLPKVDISLPSLKGTKNVKGPDINRRKVDMPSVNILPKGKAKVDLNIEEHSGKGRKFELPKVDIFLPKITPPKGDFNIEVPEFKGREINMPDIDISLPKEKVTENVDLKDGSAKGGRFQMPKVDLSLPRIKLPESGIHVDGPDIKVGKVDISFISLSQGNAKKEIAIKGEVGKNETIDEKIDVPNLDISLPKLTPPIVDSIVEGPHIKGKKFHMPDVDVSLPKVDLSLPGLKLPKGKINVEEPGINCGKVDMPSVDISLPKGEAKVDINIEGHCGEKEKFELPKVDITLPTVPTPKVDFNIDVPELKGRRINMPDIDIFLPKGKVTEGVELNVGSAKGGRFQMPKVDLSLPRINLPVGGIYVDGPDIKVRKVDMPSIDISSPKGNAEKEIDIKRGVGKMDNTDVPNFDISLSEVTPPMFDSNVKGPHIKGKKFYMPDVEVLLPKVDLSLPSLNLPEGKVNVEGPDTNCSKVDMLSVGISLPKEQAKVDLNIEGHSGKGRKFELPKVDISLPKITPSKSEFNIEVPERKGRNINMPDIDISLPKGKVTAGVDLKDVSTKGGRFQMPKVNLSLPKLKFPEAGIQVDGPDIEVGKVDMPSIDFSLPKGNAEQEIYIKCGVGKMNKNDVPNLDISSPKVTPPMFDSNIEGPHIKGRNFHMPDVDVLLPKVDLSLPSLKLPKDKINVKRPNINRGKVDMPSVDISLPKGKAKVDMNIEGHCGEEKKFEMPTVDITLPMVTPTKVDVNIDVPELTGKKINMPDIDISLPKEKVTEGVDLKDASAKRGRFQMPKVDLSLPRIKLPEGGIHGDGPDIEVGKVDMPSIDISLPKENAEQEIDIKGGVGKMDKNDVSNLDISLPKVTPPMFHSHVEGPYIKGRKFHMPDVDVSLPKVDVSLPSLKLPKGKINVEGPDINCRKVKMPSVEISLPKGEAKVDLNIEGQSGKGGRFELPKVDISLPKVTPSSFDYNIDVPFIEGRRSKFDIALPSSPEANIYVESPRGSSLTTNHDMKYEGPPIPKVTKAVFVLVNSQTESYVNVTSKANAETLDKTINISKSIQMQSFEKAHSNIKETYTESDEVEEENDLEVKTEALTIPKWHSLGGEEKLKISTKTKSGKISFPGLKETSEYSDKMSENACLVSSNARLEMLKETQCSELSVPNVSFGHVSEKTSSKSDSEFKDAVGNMQDEGKEETTWFKIPKVSGMPKCAEILQTTPEGSPDESKSSLQHTGKDISRCVYSKMSNTVFSTEEVSSSQRVTATKEKTFTTVTKTSTHKIKESPGSR